MKTHSDDERLIDITVNQLRQLLVVTISSLLREQDPIKQTLVEREELVPRLMVASEFKVTDQTLDKWVDMTDFPKPIRIGGRWYFKRSELNTYIEKGGKNV